MSVAYYIVLDNREPGFDVYVNGRFIAKEANRLDAACIELGIPQLEHFIAMSGKDISEMLGEDMDIPKGEGERWFAAEEGLAFVNALIAHIQARPKTVRSPEGILAELAEYADVFGKAGSIGAKWHLGLDI